ncbi:hypothetical protein UREOM_3030 [Ureaplasma sp. OM1]|uniref:ABC3 transporter permease C-terminal domain-containing protein n=2 Tax=Ureaplasma ceti TaxID=3119530 RepID=A0ABP9U6L4_9BACT
MIKSYDGLVDNYNLHNIVIYDKWSDVNSVRQKNESDFNAELNKLGVKYRNFESLRVINGNNQDQYKVIKYSNSYTIDKLDIFQSYGLPVNKDNQATLPTGIDFNKILQQSSQGLTGKASAKDIFARQELVYFASNAAWSTSKFANEFKAAWKVLLQHPNIDPYNPDLTGLSTSDQQALTTIEPYIKAFVDPNNSLVVPPKIRGSRITFVMDAWNNNIPATGYFDDPSSYLAVVSPEFAKDNHKEIYHYDNYLKEVGETKTTSVDMGNIHDLSTAMPTTDQFINWFQSIPNKYKVYVNSIPYLIVGTGISPDFMYPIISFQNVIPNPQKEAILYMNETGYNRTQFSFPTAPHESFILAKYDGKEALEAIVSKINVLARKYMAWPSNVTPAYTYYNPKNQMSPASLRVNFIVQLVAAIQGVSIAITIFIVVLSLFVMSLFAKRFVEQNKQTIAILISNGVNKLAVLSSIALIGVVPCIIASVLGYVVAFFLQGTALSIFSKYWMIPTPMYDFNVGWMFLAIFATSIVFAILTFFIGMWMLRGNLVALMKENGTIKVGFLANAVKSIFNWGPIMLRFRSSLAFASLMKIVTLIVMTTITGVTLTFVTSSSGKLDEVNKNDLKSNTSNFAINYFTPTVESGQYLAIANDMVGRIIHEYHQPNNGELNNQGYDQNLFYLSAFYNSPAFRKYTALHWPSALDSHQYANDILFLKNKTELQQLLMNRFGVGSESVVPWNVPLAVMPTDQINTSNQMCKEYGERLMTDMRPYNEAFFFNTGANADGTGKVLPDANNALPFPKTWAIQNFNVKNPSDWKLSYGVNGYSEKYGVISAPEIPGLTSPEAILKMQPNEIGTLINKAYSTYSNDNNWPQTPSQMLQEKYYPLTLFHKNVISNVRLAPHNKNIVLFDVNTQLNGEPYLLTTRSMFMKYLEKGVAINSDTNTSNIVLDPFANTTTYGYEPNIMTNTGPIALAYRLNFINFFLHAYMDPAYTDSFYNISYNQVVFNKATDEPYTYIDATVDSSVGKNSPIQIKGIVPDSKFINLYSSTTGKKINNKLYAAPNLLIVNQYAARKFKLKIGDEFQFTPNNTIWRYTSANPEQILTDPNAPQKLYQPWEQTFTVVGINNTGHNAEFFTSMTSAQNVLGLATAEQYQNKTNVTEQPTADNNYALSVGMNNKWNTFGGFNGMFTSQVKPNVLTSNIDLYSPNGLYPGSDSWEKNNTMITLVKNALNSPYQTAYIANALNMNNNQFTAASQTFKNNYLKAHPKATAEETQNALIGAIIDGISDIYGKMSLASITTSADAVKQAAAMFAIVSNTFDQIEGIVSALIIVLSMIIVVLLAWIIVLDMLKLAAVLKTLGYSNMSNGWNFFSAFVPTWIISLIITIPLSMLALSIFKTFAFANIGVLITAPINWWIFALIELGIAVIFLIIFFTGMSFFKKINIVEVLKW